MDNVEHHKHMDRLLAIQSQLDQMQIKSHESWTRVKELSKMGSNMLNMITELDRESVECRRLGKKTAKYLAIDRKINDSLDMLDQFVMTAILMN